jgi:integrase
MKYAKMNPGSDVLRTVGQGAARARRKGDAESGVAAAAARRTDALGDRLPGVSETTAQAMREVAAEATSKNTARTYQTAARYWQAWHRESFGQAPLPFPVTEALVLQFVTDHLVRTTAAGLAMGLPPDVDRRLVAAGVKGKLGPLSLATVTQRVAVLSKTHRLAGGPNPCVQPAVQQLLIDFQKAYAERDVAPRKQTPLTREPLLALLATCDASLRGVRDRALLLFAFSSGGRRRSEVTGATMEKLTRLPEGDFVYELRKTKTNQAGAARPDAFKAIAGPAAAAMAAWLAASGITEGPIFRRVRKERHVGEPLTPSAVRDIVKKRAAMAGLEEKFSAHSLRSGFITEAGRQNAPLLETMAASGHKSVATVQGYYHSQAGTKALVANLLTDTPPVDGGAV